MAGSVAANGSGGITGGNIDVNGFSPGFFSTPITSGSYSVGSDGRGQAVLSWSGGSGTLDFVLTSPSHGLVIEFDGDGTGSGTLDLQTTGALTGSYSFGLSGASGSNEVPLAMVGTFDTTAPRPQGISFNGLADINGNGVATPDLHLAATVTAGSPEQRLLAPTTPATNWSRPITSTCTWSM